MEKYLTPIQYEQYLHDKAYQAAMANTSPSVEQVVALTALFIVGVLVLCLIAVMWDRFEDAEEEQEEPGWKKEVRDAQTAAKRRMAGNNQ